MSNQNAAAELRQASPVLLPSLLAADFGNLQREVRQLEEAGILALHLDVMDGSFVPNLTFGLPILSALRRLTTLTLDVHLMIVHPERYAQQFVEAGADIVTFHVEAVDDACPLLSKIRDLGAAAGIALNPATPLADLDHCLDLCDLVLAMSVPAGFGGQQFDEVALEKLTTLRNHVSKDVLLEVDGGVNEGTIARCVQAGADCLVAGSAIFRHDDYSVIIDRLNQLARTR